MYTQCNECLTVYKIGAEAITAGRGSVRCGHCQATFDALTTLCEQLPPQPFEHLAVRASELELPLLAMPAYRPAPQGDLSLHHERTPRRDVVFPSRVPQVQAPTFVRAPAPVQRGSQLAWAGGCLVLGLLLAAQLAYTERDRLLNDERTRPWLDAACAQLGCELPVRHDLSAFTLISRDIRPHPSVQGALIISATLSNSSEHPVAYPTVELTMSDLNEHRIAMRRFRPMEFVRNSATLPAGLAPADSVALVFEIEDPGQNAVAFEFRFL